MSNVNTNLVCLIILNLVFLGLSGCSPDSEKKSPNDPIDEAHEITSKATAISVYGPGRPTWFERKITDFPSNISIRFHIDQEKYTQEFVVVEYSAPESVERDDAGEPVGTIKAILLPVTDSRYQILTEGPGLDEFLAMTAPVAKAKAAAQPAKSTKSTKSASGSQTGASPSGGSGTGPFGEPPRGSTVKGVNIKIGDSMAVVKKRYGAATFEDSTGGVDYWTYDRSTFETDLGDRAVREVGSQIGGMLGGLGGIVSGAAGDSAERAARKGLPKHIRVILVTFRDGRVVNVSSSSH